MFNKFLCSSFILTSVFLSSAHADDVYYQFGDTALAFDLDSIVYDLPNKNKFDITATRKVVGQVETQNYTGNFDEDNITQFHMRFDCKKKTLQFLDIMIGDKNNGEVKYKNTEKGPVIKALQGSDQDILNLVCSNAESDQ